MDGQSATYGRPGLAEANRLDAFVDAAFAFAVSLLIIAGGEPLRSFEDLLHALMRIPPSWPGSRSSSCSGWPTGPGRRWGRSGTEWRPC